MAAKRWKQLKRPSADEWINKCWYIHPTEYYSALKTNEIERHTAAWMNLGDTVLREVSLTLKSTGLWALLR